MAKKIRQKIYAVYDGDTFIDVGTKHELSELLGVTPDTIYWYSMPNNKKRNPNGRIAELLGYEDEFE